MTCDVVLCFESRSAPATHLGCGAKHFIGYNHESRSAPATHLGCGSISRPVLTGLHSIGRLADKFQTV
jgi:hypothetical protein